MTGVEPNRVDALPAAGRSDERMTTSEGASA